MISACSSAYRRFSVSLVAAEQVDAAQLVGQIPSSLTQDAPAKYRNCKRGFSMRPVGAAGKRAVRDVAVRARRSRIGLGSIPRNILRGNLIEHDDQRQRAVIRSLSQDDNSPATAFCHKLRNRSRTLASKASSRLYQRSSPARAPEGKDVVRLECRDAGHRTMRDLSPQAAAALFSSRSSRRRSCRHWSWAARRGTRCLRPLVAGELAWQDSITCFHGEGRVLAAPRRA